MNSRIHTVSGVKTEKTFIALNGFNTNYDEYLKRCTELQDSNRKGFFAGGLFIGSDDDALLVRDQQGDDERKKLLKIPGGVAQECFSHEIFLYNLHEHLSTVGYPESLRDEIVHAEKCNIRTVGERGAILESIEETNIYPKKLLYGCDGYRYNHGTYTHDMWQIFFNFETILAPYSKNYDDEITIIDKNYPLVSLDKSVKEIVKLNFAELVTQIGTLPQRKGVQELLKQRAEKFKNAGEQSLFQWYTYYAGDLIS